MARNDRCKPTNSSAAVATLKIELEKQWYAAVSPVQLAVKDGFGGIYIDVNVVVAEADRHMFSEPVIDAKIKIDQ